MDPQKGKKRGAIGLGALGALLGTGTIIAHRAGKGVKLNAATREAARKIRNVAGVGAVGAGLGSALLTTKYYRAKRGGVQ